MAGGLVAQCAVEAAPTQPLQREIGSGRDRRALGPGPAVIADLDAHGWRGPCGRSRRESFRCSRWRAARDRATPAPQQAPSLIASDGPSDCGRPGQSCWRHRSASLRRANAQEPRCLDGLRREHNDFATRHAFAAVTTLEADCGDAALGAACYCVAVVSAWRTAASFSAKARCTVASYFAPHGADRDAARIAAAGWPSPIAIDRVARLRRGANLEMCAGESSAHRPCPGMFAG